MASPAAAAEPKKEGMFVRTMKLLASGGVAGAVARTAVSPFDRVKLLFQVQHLQGGEQKYTGVVQAFVRIYKEEGFLSFWRGNGVNVIRVVPYSAAQMMSYEQYKMMLLREDQKDLSIPQRLFAGACAGMTGTALTHPLDTLRLRLAVNTELTGVIQASKYMYQKEGLVSFWRGIGPTLVGIAPYVGINFAMYDTLKRYFLGDKQKLDILTSLGVGALAGTIAQTVCYPLDTIRRRQQYGTGAYKNGFDACVKIMRGEGVSGFYKGYVANTIKVVPNNAIRFLTFEVIKKVFGVQKVSTDI
eukprot:TRINITY_DN14363_c0_g1_i1.p1 TRINITY_DN14363_c0_g1~~TRINITY_DN14363_c0_g1_i1.p1  ORF type:complete len:301 (+),score=85.96 TRINITY_DN14363_c0_g1_i1:1-903(+)